MAPGAVVLEVSDRNDRRSGMSDAPLLIVEGLVHNRLSLTLADLSSYPAEAQIPDVSQLVPQREGEQLVYV